MTAPPLPLSRPLLGRVNHFHIWHQRPILLQLSSDCTSYNLTSLNSWMLNDCNFCNFLILIRKFSRSHCPSGRDKICNSFRIAVKERPKQLQRFCNTKSEVKRVGTLGDYPHLLYQLLLVRYIHHNSKSNKSQVDLTRATRKRSETAGHTPVCEWHCACCDRWWFTKLSVTVSIDLKVGQARTGRRNPLPVSFTPAC